MGGARSRGARPTNTWPVWRSLALALAVLLVLSLLAGFAGARIQDYTTRGTERTALDAALAVTWLIAASLVVGRGRRRLAL